MATPKPAWRRIQFSIFVITILSYGITIAYAEAVVTADKVFETISPSVARIESLDGHGSGIVLSEDGLILTNAHVLSLPLELRVQVQTVVSGATKTIRYEDVEIIGYHKLYDLALLRIDVGSHSLLPISNEAADPPRVGSTCWAIGNPSVGEQVLTNTITNGIISAVGREIDGTSYIQTNAEVNPGSSGGPLIGEDGRVIGVVTIKADQAEGLGFAIPISVADESQFGKDPPSLGTNSHRLHLQARELIQMADESKYYAEKQYLYNQAKQLLITAAYGRDAGQVLEDLGYVSIHMEEPKLAKAYLRHALDRKPTVATFKYLGILSSNAGEKEEALNWYRQAFDFYDQIENRSANDTFALSGCAQNMAADYLALNDPARAAYMVQWARSISDTILKRREAFDIILNAVLPSITYAQRREIMKKNGNFSFGDLERFVALEPDPETNGLHAEVADAQARAAQRYAAIEKHRQSPSPVTQKGISIPLAGSPVEAKLAYSGQYLITRYADTPRLEWINLHSGRPEVVIDLKSNDVIYACGGDVLLVCYPNFSVIERYRVTDQELLEVMPIDLPGRAISIAMGLENDRTGVIAWQTNSASQTSNASEWSRFDVKQRKLIDMPAYHTWDTSVHFTTNTALTLISEFTSSPPRSKAHYFKEDDVAIPSLGYSKKSSGLITMGASKKSVSTEGMEIGINGETVRHHTKNSERSILFSGSDTSGVYIAVVASNKEDPKIHVYHNDHIIGTYPFQRINADTIHQHTQGVKNLSLKTTDLAPEQHVFAISRLQRLAVVEPAGQRVMLYEINLPRYHLDGADTVDRTGPGQKWIRRLKIDPSTSIEIVRGPNQLSVNKSNQLVWQVPEAQPTGEIEILLLLKHADGAAAYERVTVQVVSP